MFPEVIIRGENSSIAFARSLLIIFLVSKLLQVSVDAKHAVSEQILEIWIRGLPYAALGWSFKMNFSSQLYLEECQFSGSFYPSSPMSDIVVLEA